jgi:hypothetical protein
MNSQVDRRNILPDYSRMSADVRGPDHHSRHYNIIFIMILADDNIIFFLNLPSRTNPHDHGLRSDRPDRPCPAPRVLGRSLVRETCDLQIGAIDTTSHQRFSKTLNRAHELSARSGGPPRPGLASPGVPARSDEPTPLLHPGAIVGVRFVTKKAMFRQNKL